MDLASTLSRRCSIAGVLLAVFVLIGGATVVAGRAGAQTVAEAGKIAVNLPQESRAVIDRLSGLRELPDGAWKMHSGDQAHGEAANLDESDWQAISKGSPAPKDAVWFRQTYQVPETLSGYDL